MDYFKRVLPLIRPKVAQLGMEVQPLDTDEYQILIDLGVKKIILLANSSKNIVGIDGFGLEINGTKKI